MPYDHWNSPLFIVERLHKIERVTVDPCSNRTSIVRAKIEISKPRNGLKIRWKGFTYINPPFSSIYPWVERTVTEQYSQRTLRHIVLFIPFSPETKYFKLIWKLTPMKSQSKNPVRAVIGVFPTRVRLDKPRKKKDEKFISPMVSNVLVYSGLHPRKFINAFSDTCTFITDWKVLRNG